MNLLGAEMRNRQWLTLLADLLKISKTCMGKLLCEDVSTRQFLAAGLRLQGSHATKIPRLVGLFLRFSFS